METLGMNRMGYVGETDGINTNKCDVKVLAWLRN